MVYYSEKELEKNCKYVYHIKSFAEMQNTDSIKWQMNYVQKDKDCEIYRGYFSALTTEGVQHTLEIELCVEEKGNLIYRVLHRTDTNQYNTNPIVCGL